MKLKIIGLFLVLFVWAGWIGAIKTPLAAPAPGAGLKQQLKSNLQGSNDQIDLAENLLLVSRHWEPGLDLKAQRAILDQLTEAVKTRLGNDPTAKDTVRVLREVIHQQGGYDYTDFVDPQGIPLNPAELFLHGLLKSKRGYCMNLSLLYLIIADRLNLPLYGVPLPNHFFVRYEKDQDRINIETTQRGEILPDQFYQQRFNAPQDHPYFMKNLDKKRTLGAYFSNVGMVMYRQNRSDDALFYMQVSVQTNPRAIDARNNLANMYAELRQNDKAIEQYEAALRIDPNNLATLYNLGTSYKDAGKNQKAAETFLQVVAIDPAYAPAHQNLATLFMKQKKYFSALIHLGSLADLNPRNLEIRLNMADLYLRMDQFDVAIDFLRTVQKDFPMRLDVNGLMAEAHYRAGDLDAALVQYEYITQRQPKAQSAFIQVGWIHYKKGDLDKAIEWTEQGLKVDEQQRMVQLAHMNLGLFHLLKGKTDIAEKEYLMALEGQSGSMEAMVQDLKDAQNVYPDKHGLLFYEAWVYAKGNSKTAARAQLRAFLKKYPADALASRAKNLLKELGGEVGAPPDKDMVKVPGGMFLMGSNDHGEDESPEHEVFISDFFMDKYEVTAQDFARYLNTASPEDVKRFAQVRDSSTFVFDGKKYIARNGLENYPANTVTWFGAKAYCEWQEKRLPTEAEWEKTARGTTGQIYPWGNGPPDPERARYLQDWTEELKHKVMVPVDSMPLGRGPFGTHHMAGNVKEWVDDWYDREYYKEDTHKANPEGQVGGQYKSLRGGSWRDLKVTLYASFRNNSTPQTGMDDYGFRCAKSASETPAPGKLTSLETPATVLMGLLKFSERQVNDWRN